MLRDILFPVVVLLISGPVFGADETCAQKVEQALALSMQPPQLGASEAHRLASEVQSQAQNIIAADIAADPNLKWIESESLYVSRYSISPKDQIDLLFVEEGLISAYRLKKNDVVSYQCISLRQINSASKNSAKGSKHAKQKK